MTHEYPVELVGHRLSHVAVQIKGRDYWNRTNLPANGLDEISFQVANSLRDACSM